MEGVISALTTRDECNRALELLRRAIVLERVALFKALLVHFPRLFEREFILHGSLDVWDQITQFRLCRGEWTAALEEMVLLLLQHGYPANYLDIAENIYVAMSNRAWEAVSVDTSSMYLLRCYSDLGARFINPSCKYSTPPRFRPAIAFGALNWKQVDAERNEKLALLRSVWNNWNPTQHKDFPRSFGLAVFTFLLVRQRESHIRYCIDKNIVQIIVHELACIWCLGRLPVEDIWSPPLSPRLIVLTPPTERIEGRNMESDGVNLLLLLFSDEHNYQPTHSSEVEDF
jgi:hypothetical protein